MIREDAISVHLRYLSPRSSLLFHELEFRTYFFVIDFTKITKNVLFMFYIFFYFEEFCLEQGVFFIVFLANRTPVPPLYKPTRRPP